MQGQSECLSENAVVENAYEYKWLSNSMVKLKNPVGEDITCAMEEGYAVTRETNLSQWLSDHVLGRACYGNTNLVPSFCRAYIKTTGHTVLAVHAAKGSTRIQDWLPNSDGYRAIVSKSLSAIQKVKEQHNVDRILFVWLQGESDAVAGVSKNDYKTEMMNLASGLKTDLCIERFGVIRVGAFANDYRDDEIIAAQGEICREDNFFAMLTECATELNKDALMMNPNVRGHYSARGLEYLGERAGTTLGNLIVQGE